MLAVFVWHVCVSSPRFESGSLSLVYTNKVCGSMVVSRRIEKDGVWRKDRGGESPDQ